MYDHFIFEDHLHISEYSVTNYSDSANLFSNEPFAIQKASSARCSYCGRNVTSNCNSHLPTCIYSCNYTPPGVHIGDGFLIMLVLVSAYILSKFIKK